MRAFDIRDYGSKSANGVYGACHLVEEAVVGRDLKRQYQEVVALFLFVSFRRIVLVLWWWRVFFRLQRFEGARSDTHVDQGVGNRSIIRETKAAISRSEGLPSVSDTRGHDKNKRTIKLTSSARRGVGTEITNGRTLALGIGLVRRETARERVDNIVCLSRVMI